MLLGGKKAGLGCRCVSRGHGGRKRGCWVVRVALMVRWVVSRGDLGPFGLGEGIRVLLVVSKAKGFAGLRDGQWSFRGGERGRRVLTSGEGCLLGFSRVVRGPHLGFA
jgi:hypothetical protein